MTLNSRQIELIIYIDKRVKNYISKGLEDTKIMISVLDKISELRELISNTDKKELEMYLAEYNGFQYYMKLLDVEEIAQSFKEEVR